MDSVMDDGVLLRRVSPFGNLRIVAYVPLPEAYRSLSRPSSAPDAKAFPLRSYSLNLVQTSSVSFASAQAPKLAHSAVCPLHPEAFASLGSGTGVTDFVSSFWFSELCRLIQDHSFTKLLPKFLCSTIKTYFPSVALLVFPLFSFQCAASVPSWKQTSMFIPEH